MSDQPDAPDVQPGTPLPWRVEPNDENALPHEARALTGHVLVVAPWGDGVRPSHSDGIGDHRGIHVAALEHQGTNQFVSRERADRDARFIVAACNAHPSLRAEVAKLREALRQTLRAPHSAECRMANDEMFDSFAGLSAEEMAGVDTSYKCNCWHHETEAVLRGDQS